MILKVDGPLMCMPSVSDPIGARKTVPLSLILFWLTVLPFAPRQSGGPPRGFGHPSQSKIPLAPLLVALLLWTLLELELLKALIPEVPLKSLLLYPTSLDVAPLSTTPSNPLALTRLCEVVVPLPDPHIYRP